MKKHTATHEGFTFTRNSAGRAYTHVVLVRGSLAADRVDCEKYARDSFKMNRGFHQEYLDGTSRWLARKDWETEAAHAARIEGEKAKAEDFLSGGVEGFVARALARFDAANSKGKLAADGDTYYTAAGWCGRPDLAAKLAASSGGFAVACAMVDTKAKAAATA